MKPMRVFFSQPIDFLTKASVRQQVHKLDRLTKNLDIKVIAPYTDEDERDLHQDPMTRREAEEIVDKNLKELESSDIVVADVSQENRQAIGMMFEIAHARYQKKRIIVHAGDSSIGKRVFIQVYADAICGSWDEVVDKLADEVRVRVLAREKWIQLCGVFLRRACLATIRYPIAFSKSPLNHVPSIPKWRAKIWAGLLRASSPESIHQRTENNTSGFPATG